VVLLIFMFSGGSTEQGRQDTAAPSPLPPQVGTIGIPNGSKETNPNSKSASGSRATSSGTRPATVSSPTIRRPTAPKASWPTRNRFPGPTPNPPQTPARKPPPTKKDIARSTNLAKKPTVPKPKKQQTLLRPTTDNSPKVNPPRTTKTDGAVRSSPGPAISPFDDKQARLHQQAWADHLGVPVEVTSKRTGMRLRLIPPGIFQMGSPPSEPNRKDPSKADDEHIHPVQITRAFYMATHEVTKDQYVKLKRRSPWVGKPNVSTDPKTPATHLSASYAMDFCRSLSTAEGIQYRLPTEGEWEYACRAGTATAFSFGGQSSRLGSYAWYRENSWDIGRKYAQRVGTKRPNPWGLHDMHGNVWEWCSDWYGAYPRGPVVDPQGPSRGESRVARGGACDSETRLTRSAFRYNLGPKPGGGSGAMGFRVVCSSVTPGSFTRAKPATRTTKSGK